jgi:hypothetical protein
MFISIFLVIIACCHPDIWIVFAPSCQITTISAGSPDHLCSTTSWEFEKIAMLIP